MDDPPAKHPSSLDKTMYTHEKYTDNYRIQILDDSGMSYCGIQVIQLWHTGHCGIHVIEAYKDALTQDGHLKMMLGLTDLLYSIIPFCELPMRCLAWCAIAWKTKHFCYECIVLKKF